MVFHIDHCCFYLWVGAVNGGFCQWLLCWGQEGRHYGGTQIAGSSVELVG